MSKPTRESTNLEALDRFWRRSPFHDDSIEEVTAINKRVIIRLTNLTLVVTGVTGLVRCELPAVWLAESIVPKGDGFLLDVETDDESLQITGKDMGLIRNDDPPMLRRLIRRCPEARHHLDDGHPREADRTITGRRPRGAGHRGPRLGPGTGRAFAVPHHPRRSCPRPRPARQRDALCIAIEQDRRPRLRLPVRGMEPGPQTRLVPPVVHPAHRDRPVDGAARDRRRRAGRHAAPLPARGPRSARQIGQDPPGRPGRSQARGEGAARQLPRPRHRQAARAAGVERRQDEILRNLRRDQERSPLEGPQGSRLAQPPPRRHGGRHHPRGEVWLRALRRPARPVPGRTDPAEGDGPARRPGRHADLRRQLEPLRLRRQDHRRPALPRGQGPARGRRCPPRPRRSSSTPRGPATPSFTTPNRACSTSAGTPPATASSAGTTSRESG